MRSAPRLESREVKGSGWWTCESCKDSWLVPQFMASDELLTLADTQADSSAGSAELPTKCQFHPVPYTVVLLFAQVESRQEFRRRRSETGRKLLPIAKTGRNGKLGMPHSWFAYCKFGWSSALGSSIHAFVCSCRHLQQNVLRSNYLLLASDDRRKLVCDRNE